ncbi:MAG: class I SAM-dependent methyltransferase family protein [Thaumarchaeota archaeon]|nr:class I SAM-dependent methyltransferase family protein [Candidatus Calditenuaceae archaeon]MDW8187545.1 class I SAM-dependent methyltransferase family protein [Nitrososphaerota archaeon]
MRTVELACVSVGRERAEELRRALIREGLLVRGARPRKVGEVVLFPVMDRERALKLAERFGAEVGSSEFEVEERPRGLKEAMSELPDDLRCLIPSSYDVIGDIAAVHVPEPLWPLRHRLGEAIMQVNRSIKVVLGEKGPIRSEFRLREFEWLAGERRTVTIHRENGCEFELDLSRVYFSPRLSGERWRVVSLVRADEKVLDMFAGVGPFAVEIAKHKGARVTAIELNPDAYSYLVRNVERNRVSRLVEAINDDSRRAVGYIQGPFDRVIMNYPTGSLDFLDAATALSKRGTTVHVYGFASSIDDWSWRVTERLSELSIRIGEVSVRKVREVSAARMIAVADFEVASRSFDG